MAKIMTKMMAKNTNSYDLGITGGKNPKKTRRDSGHVTDATQMKAVTKKKGNLLQKIGKKKAIKTIY